MAKLNKVYKCNICGNVVIDVVEGSGELVCDGQPMEQLIPKSHDEGQEKHVPVIEKDGNTVTVKIGEVPHPMEEEHHICFIELFVGDEIYRKYLTANDEPKAEFKVCSDVNDLKAREYCNVHGLWTN